MSNPGPASSSQLNVVGIGGSFDGNSKITGLYGSGNSAISPLDFSRVTQSPTATVYSTIPVGVAPTGSVAANGALTLGTALDSTYGPTGVSPGIFLYFPLGAVYPGSLAGLYLCVMTSTTLGTVFNNTYTPPGIATIPSSPIAIVAPSMGAYTGATSEIAVGGFIIPANSFGATGGMRKIWFLSSNNTANAKTARIRFGGLSGTIYESANTANNVSASGMVLVYNRGTGFQTGPGALAFGVSTSAVVTSTVDTTQDVTVYDTIQLATATDWMIWQAEQTEIFAR